MKTAKMWVAALGTTLTALTTALATVQLVLSDDKIDIGEYGTIAIAVVTLVTTVWAVWRVPNKEITAPAQSGYIGSFQEDSDR